jgi:serine O-acetyltransferase
MSAPSYRPSFAETLVSLSRSGDDALSKADTEGYPDWDAAVEWTERLKAVILHQRDRGALRSTLDSLHDRFLALLEKVGLSSDADPEAIWEDLQAALPEIRALLAEDVEAAFEGDPAAKSFGEIVASYPSICSITIYRLAHVLYQAEVPQLPRIMAEHAHSRTGIDIHPGAVIGRRFFIDHGTGVVIGETSEIGDRVRIYHGVTLGAFSPRRGQTIRGMKRHPTIRDDVTIYPGATILGGDTVIGAGSVINGNAFIIESVPPDSRVVSEPLRQEVRLGRSTNPDGGPADWDI